MNDYVFLFPAFVLKYKGNEIKNINDNGIDFSVRLKEVSEIAGIDLTSFDISGNNFMDDELKNQLVTYLISCLYSDILKSKNIFPKNITFLSMGIYSALYCADSINLRGGILLIKRLFENLHSQVSGMKYKMLAITGLSKDDINSIISRQQLDCNIVIKNNQHSYIVTGLDDAILILYDIAQEEGAIHQNLFPVSIPYHSNYINTHDLGYSLFEDIEIKKPAYGIISSLNQKDTNNEEQIKQSILSNLISYIDWHKTKTFLINKGNTNFIECGPGDSLKRTSKFIDGNFKVTGIVINL